jgi:hypothetical protein
MTARCLEPGCYLRGDWIGDDCHGHRVGFDKRDLLADGLTVRQIEHWTRCGYLKADVKHPGTGSRRVWPAAERPIARRMVALVRAGVSAHQAAYFARVAPATITFGEGITLTLEAS